MAKKKNSRKVLAVALGIMGIAGLSLASASQLNITATPDNLATGIATFGTACDDTVAVAYTAGVDGAGAPTYTGYVVTGIADKCMTPTAKKLTSKLSYFVWNGTAYATTASSLTSTDQTIVVATPAVVDDNKVVVTFGSPLAGTTKLTDIAITIK